VNIQWLMYCLVHNLEKILNYGLGLGFGLQKIFANLVSGFIILADKSIKPGDVIQLKDPYGWIRIRPPILNQGVLSEIYAKQVFFMRGRGSQDPLLLDWSKIHSPPYCPQSQTS
jgi:hypothetical protein